MAAAGIAQEKPWLWVGPAARLFSLSAAKKDRLAAVFPNVDYWIQSGGEAGLLAAIADEAETCEASEHHHPGGDFRNCAHAE
jgi:hypothetical protein